MRRPHVYERSVPRTRREAYQEPGGDPATVAQVIARTLPAMIQDAEDAGLTILADHLIGALKSAEGRSAEHEPPLERLEGAWDPKCLLESQRRRPVKPR